MRELCAVCDSTNDTTALCAECKRDPANADWHERPWWEVSASDVLEDGQIGAEARPETAERAWQPSELAKAILTAWDSGKVNKTESVPYIDKQGRRRGTVRRKIKVRSKRHLAQVLGCDEKLVRELIQREGSKRNVGRVCAEQMAA